MNQKYKPLRNESNITIQAWSKHGWTSYIPKDKVRYTKRNKVTRDEVDFNGPRGEMDIIQDVHNEIMYGPVGLQIDELPGPLKDMFQQPSLWHIVNTRLFKILDEETQLQENGDWGTDKDDEDLESFEGITTTSRLFLEQANILPADASTDEVTDILGNITDGSEISEGPYNQRLNTDIQHISIMSETSGNAVFNNEICMKDNCF